LLNVCYLSLDAIKENFIVNLAKKLPGRLVCSGLYGVIRHAYEFQNFWRIAR
jgi:hypothetical protein